MADVPGADGCCFNVLSTRKAFVLRAPSGGEKAAWLAALETAIEEQVARLGAASPEGFAAIWQPDAVSKSCSICAKDFTLVVRRHHCRVCGALACDTCTKRRAVIAYIDPERPVRVCGVCWAQGGGRRCVVTAH